MSDSREAVTYEQFLNDSAERQQMLFSRFGDREWDEIPMYREDVIRTKVSWFVFNKDYHDLIEADDKKERTTVDNAICKLINSSGSANNLLLGCFYVDILLKKDNTVGIIPILRTKKSADGIVTFYEPHSERVYNGGCEAYEKNNKLPPCWMCFPQGGIYQSHSYEESSGRRVLLKYCESPSCHSVLPTVDVISLVGGGLCTAVLASSALFPPLLAFEVTVLAAGAGMIGSGIYGTTRAICELHDRNQHQQSCSISDPGAFRQWLNVILSAGSALTAGGSVVIKAAALKGVFLVSNANLKLAASILRYLSVGVNGLGIIAIVIDLVIKYLQHGLESVDLQKFVSLCLLISNIVISTDQAEFIIRFMANQPQRLRNAFNMVRNTTVTAVKAIMDNVPWLGVLDIVSGDVGMNILRHIGFGRTTQVIAFVRNRIRRCMRERGNIAFTLLEILQHCYLFFTEVLLEVREACSKIEKWFGRALCYIPINNNRVFENSSSALALDITDEVDRVLDDIEILDDTVRDDSAKNIVNLINSVANEAHCSTDTEYVKIAEIVSDRLRNRCDTELIVRQLKATEYLTDKKKSDTLGKIISDLERSSNKGELVDIFKEEKFFPEMKKNMAFWKPIYQNAKNSVYFFETLSKNFDQFVHDAACQLLETEDTSHCEFYLHDKDTIMCIRDGDKTLIFNYDIERSIGKVKGIIIVDVDE